MPSLAWFIHGCCRALSDSRLSRLRIAAGLLFLLSLHDPSVSAQAPATSQGSNQPDASPAAGAPISVEELAHRLERLEQQNAKLAEQNHSLVKQLEAVTSRYDQLNRRLEQIEPRAGIADANVACTHAAGPGSFPRRCAATPNGSGSAPGLGLGTWIRIRTWRDLGDPWPIRGRPAARRAGTSRILEVPGRRATTTIEAVRPGPAQGCAACSV